MSMTRIFAAGASLLLVAGCQATPNFITERAALANIPESLKVECDQVVDIPHRALSTTEASRLWAQDRTTLGDCRARHDALVGAVAAIEVQGKPQ